MTYYKYRSLSGDGFKRFVQIITQKRLYAAKFTDLNDSMEGVFYYQIDAIEKETLESLKKEKEGLNICSLSTNRDQPLMWAHYADGSRGVNIKLELQNDVADIVNYHELTYIEAENKYIINRNSHRSGKITAKELLLTKLPYWAYEEEVRVLSPNNFVRIEVKEVILGEKMEHEDRRFLKVLIPTINKNIKITECITNRSS